MRARRARVLPHHAPCREPLAQVDGMVAGLPRVVTVARRQPSGAVGQSAHLLETVACCPMSPRICRCRSGNRAAASMPAPTRWAPMPWPLSWRPLSAGRRASQPRPARACRTIPRIAARAHRRTRGPGRGHARVAALVVWRTWHTYPQTGEVVVTSSSLWRGGPAPGEAQS